MYTNTLCNRYPRLMSMTFYDVYQNHLNIGMFMANQERWVFQLFCNTCFILPYRDQYYIKANGTNFYFSLLFSNVRSLNRGFFLFLANVSSLRPQNIWE